MINQKFKNQHMHCILTSKSNAPTYVSAFDLLVRMQCICWFLNFWFVIMMHGEYNVKFYDMILKHNF
jgi:hypothetical protein